MNRTLLAALLILSAPGPSAWAGVAAIQVPRVGNVPTGLGVSGAAGSAGGVVLNIPLGLHLHLVPVLSSPGASPTIQTAQTASAQVHVAPAAIALAEKTVTAQPQQKNRIGHLVLQGLRETAQALHTEKGNTFASSVLGAEFDGYRVEYDPAGKVDLAQEDPESTKGFKKKGKKGNRGNKKAVKRLHKDIKRLQEYQEKLYASGKQSVLVVFQAMDTGGKDGSIRYVLGPLNPQGVRVASFKKPTPQEVKKGYLWRIKKALPAKGMMGVFNRSHYEDILVPTVEGTLPAEVLEARYEEIRDFEKSLAEKGTVIMKFFLHISKDEQKRRLKARLADPAKHWKFDPNDLKSRAKWDKYMRTFEKVLARTSTPWAPWYIIPSNNKWFRNALIGRIIAKTMKAMNLRFPDAPEGLKDIVVPD